jgi:ribosomal protein S18 acetylase RimI-like enzyme
VIRPASSDDLDAIAPLAARLVREHHHYDPQRFFLPERVEEGYRWWLGRELANPQATLLVAEEDGVVVGYTYGRLEERDWNALLDECGALHDVYVDEKARRRGIARALVMAMCDALKKRGAPRIVLHTASPNAAAQALFSSLGFRSTMIELTRELP